jgi:hypothetical protein
VAVAPLSSRCYDDVSSSGSTTTTTTMIAEFYHG